MQFGLYTPCKDCPFTIGCLKGWLGAERMAQIMDSLDDDTCLFACHETYRRPRQDQLACAGMLIFQENHNLRAILTRIAMLQKEFDPHQLRGQERVFATIEAAIAHHR